MKDIYTSCLCPETNIEDALLTKEKIKEISDSISKKISEEITKQLNESISSFKKNK